MARAKSARRGTGKRAEAVEQTARSFRRASAAVISHRLRAVRDLGVSPPQVWIIKILVDRGGATPKELAEALCVTPASITGLVRKLEKNGFVTRERDAEDRRVVRLQPTRKAKSELRALRRAALAGANEAFAGWTTKEILALKVMLDRLGGDAEFGGPPGEARRRRPRRP